MIEKKELDKKFANVQKAFDETRGLLSKASQNFENGVISSHTLLTSLSQSIGSLIQADQVMSAMLQDDNREIIASDHHLQNYVEMIESFRQHASEIIHTLKRFRSIYSEVQTYEEALIPFREEAEAIIQTIPQDVFPLPKEYKDKIYKFELFLEAMTLVQHDKMTDEPSSKWDEDFPKLFSSFIYRGLVTQRFLEGERGILVDKIKEKKPQESHDQTQEHIESDHLVEVISNKQKELDYKALLSDLKQPGFTDMIFTLIYAFGMLTAKQIHQFVFFVVPDERNTVDIYPPMINKLIQRSHLSEIKIPQLKESIFLFSKSSMMAIRKRAFKEKLKENTVFYLPEEYPPYKLSDMKVQEAYATYRRADVMYAFLKWMREHHCEVAEASITKHIRVSPLHMMLEVFSIGRYHLKAILQPYDIDADDQLQELLETDTDIALCLLYDNTEAIDDASDLAFTTSYQDRLYSIHVHSKEHTVKRYHNQTWINLHDFFEPGPTSDGKVAIESEKLTDDANKDLSKNPPSNHLEKIDADTHLASIEENQDDMVAIDAHDLDVSVASSEKQTDEQTSTIDQTTPTKHQTKLDNQPGQSEHEIEVSLKDEDPISLLLESPYIIHDEDLFFQAFSMIVTQQAIPEALTYVKGLSVQESHPTIKPLFSEMDICLSSALNIFEAQSMYNSQLMARLEQADQFTNAFPDLSQLLMLMSYLWASVFPDKEGMHTIYDMALNYMRSADKIKSSQLNALETLLKDMVFEAKQYQKCYVNGILQKDAVHRQETDSFDKIFTKTSKEAEDHLVNSKMNKAFIHLFGSKTEMHRSLEIVASNDQEKASIVLDFLTSYFDCDPQKACFIEPVKEHIQSYAIKHWEQVREFTTDFVKKQFNGIFNRVKLLQQWYQQTQAKTTQPHQEADELIKINHQIIIKSQQLIDTIDAYQEFDNIEQEAYMTLMKFGLVRLTQAIKGEHGLDQTLYHVFWQTPYIRLSDEHLPIISPQMESVTGYATWLRVLRHMVAKKNIGIQEIEAYIKDDQNEPWYGNIGTFVQMLHYHGPERASDDKRSMKKASEQINQLIEDARDSAHRQFGYYLANAATDEQTIETYNEIIDSAVKTFVSWQDYARFRMFINAFIDVLEQDCATLKKDYHTRLQDICKQQQVTKTSLINRIAQFIENHNFAVAQDMMNALESNPDMLDPTMTWEIPLIHQFLEDAGVMIDICDQENLRNTNVNAWSINTLSSKFDYLWNRDNFEEAQKLLACWPSEKTKWSQIPKTKEHIQTLLSRLGLNNPQIKNTTILSVEEATGKTTNEPYDHFHITFHPFSNNRQKYAHPMSFIGSKLTQLNVIWEYSPSSTTEIYEHIKHALTKKHSHLIVFYNGVLSLKDRRKITQTHIENQNRPDVVFLIIDRPMLLFLANLEPEKRFDAILHCTLPFMFYQPYNRSGMGSIDQDMFFGREDELDLILSPQCPHLLYGGRQLGKSALLEKAASVAHNPKKKSYAVYIELFKDVDVLEKELKEKMVKFGFAPSRLRSLDKLLKLIEQEIIDENIKLFYLFIDEANQLLNKPESKKLKLISMLSQIAKNTGNRFRFILAGLHNVARTRMLYKENSEISHLGEPLCIKPLQQADAYKMIKRPMSYLGMNMSDDLAAIIASSSNYYPGIIHNICYYIVDSVKTQYRNGHYSAAKQNPPYEITKEHLSKTSDQSIFESVKTKVNLTITHDIKYEMISNIFAYLYHIEKPRIALFKGFDLQRIVEEIKSCRIQCLMKLPLDEIRSLLLEMNEMGILYYDQKSDLYRLRKSMFREIIGTESETLDALEKGSKSC